MNATKTLLHRITNPFFQAGLIGGLIILLSLIDLMLPHSNTLLSPEAGTWVVATAMMLCYVILNTIIALRIEHVISYWSRSVILFIGLLVFSYIWCWLLSGRHIDDVGTFRWLWFVLTLTYMVFFGIARSMKRIVDLAIRQDKKLRGEE